MCTTLFAKICTLVMRIASKDKDNHQSGDEKPRTQRKEEFVLEFSLKINFLGKSQILSACLKSNSICSISKYLGPEQCKTFSANLLSQEIANIFLSELLLHHICKVQNNLLLKDFQKELPYYLF